LSRTSPAFLRNLLSFSHRFQSRGRGPRASAAEARKTGCPLSMSRCPSVPRWDGARRISRRSHRDGSRLTLSPISLTLSPISSESGIQAYDRRPRPVRSAPAPPARNTATHPKHARSRARRARLGEP
jgi:hypothetical protein